MEGQPQSQPQERVEFKPPVFFVIMLALLLLLNAMTLVVLHEKPKYEDILVERVDRLEIDFQVLSQKCLQQQMNFQNFTSRLRQLTE